ncbi:conjugal transfer protein TraH, partial [Francisellaceae bacterium]|nr:conjugal transfer protein TraH [Francisellaceae bacterium]
KLVQFGQEVMMDAIPVAIDLALKTVSPMLAGIKDKLQTWADKINQLNMNSCEAAQDLVSGKWAKDLAGQAKACKDQGIGDGTFSDWADAIYGCATGGQAEQETNKAGSNPTLKNLVIRNKNIIWSGVLQPSAFLSEDKSLEQVYMAISGTVVFDKDSHVRTYYTRMADPNLVNALLYGGKAPTYSCDEYDNCLNIDTDATTTITADHALVNQVTTMINSLHTTYQNDQPLTVKEKSFISLTDAPILKMIQDEFNAGMTSTSMQKYSEVIAQRLLSVYLNKILSNIQTALSSATMNEASRQIIKDSLTRAETTVRSLSLKSYQQLSAAQMMLDRTLKIAQIGAANLSSKAKQNMKFGARS